MVSCYFDATLLAGRYDRDDTYHRSCSPNQAVTVHQSGLDASSRDVSSASKELIPICSARVTCVHWQPKIKSRSGRLQMVRNFATVDFQSIKQGDKYACEYVYIHSKTSCLTPTVNRIRSLKLCSNSQPS